MEESILEAVKRFSLLQENRNITVALSGGADSMCLLYALLSLKEKLNIEVSAAHLNHQIRGEEALRDEAFVKEQCEKLKVKLYCERVDVPEYAKCNNLSIELAAREVRYEFLRRVSNGLVATAHTASDNLETMLFNLSRGTAIDGLCGIPPKRDIFIRPLLLCTRAEVEAYCEKNNIPYVTDSTNLTDDYTRNKIRHNVVSVLKEINPAIETTASRTAAFLREDAFVLNSKAEEFFFNAVSANNSLLLNGFKSLAPAIAKRVIIKFVDSLKLQILLESIHIEAIYNVALNGGRTSLPKNCSAIVNGNELFVVKNGEDGCKNTEFKVCIAETENIFFKNTKKVNNLLLKNLLDRDKIVGKWILRTRLPGDCIRLKNRGCTKTLNKLYSESCIPTELRDSIPVIADENGVIWVYGIGVAHRCAVSATTKYVYKIDTQKREV